MFCACDLLCVTDFPIQSSKQKQRTVIMETASNFFNKLCIPVGRELIQFSFSLCVSTKPNKNRALLVLACNTACINIHAGS